MELKELTIKDRGSITNLFTSVFTNEPWNDDWSDHAQLDAYIHDLIGQDNSLTLGYCELECGSSFRILTHHATVQY